MKIREYLLSDKKRVDEIYKQFHDKNEYPNFKDDFICAFVVTDDEDNIILAAGVKTILEAVAVTDKTKSIRQRQEALLQTLGSTIHLATDTKFKQIHAFVRSEDEDYINHLQKYGFQLIDAKVLVLNIGNYGQKRVDKEIGSYDKRRTKVEG